MPAEGSDAYALYNGQISTEAYQVLIEACGREVEFRNLVENQSSIPFMVRAIEATPMPAGERVDDWIVKVTASYLDALCTGQPFTKDILSTVANEDFLLGECPRYPLDYIQEECPLNDDGNGSRWLAAYGYSDLQFTNSLVRDFFVAAALPPQNLIRFEYPERWVLMFLAVIAPDLVAAVTARRTSELRIEMEEEVAQRVQAALSHQLKRSAGAVRSNLKRIRAKIPQEQFEQIVTEYDRISQETQFQIDLAERTGLWSAEPTLAISTIHLNPVVEDATSALKEMFPHIAVYIELPPLHAEGDMRMIREILFCLAENAFHAVAHSTPTNDSRITIRGEETPTCIRIEILDTGPGVHPDDVDRIFEPRVTTKKGSGGQPLGTGMGLPIARRYARLLEGRVDIEPEATQTCFFLELPRPVRKDQP